MPDSGTGVVVGSLQPDVQMAGRQSLGQTLTPLDDHHGVIEVGVEVERIEFSEQVGAAGVEHNNFISP